MGKTKYTIEDMKKIAATKNGKCLSDKYINFDTKLEWECEKGHTWKSNFDSIKQGRWCPKCGIKRRTEKLKSTIEQMVQLAESRGGKCLSSKYINTETKLKWECNKGHTWEATPHMIKAGNWCPHCFSENRGKNNRKYTIKDMEKFAQSRGGNCLSEEYNPAKLLWKCSNGHTWEARYKSLKRGDWCPECNTARYFNESKCRFILESLLQAKFKKNRTVLQNGLELDGYNKEYNLAFEYNGQQHYEPIRWFHNSDKVFRNQFYRDHQKMQSCKDKNINLLIIPYIESKTDIKLINFIKTLLNKLKIKIKKDITEIEFAKFYNDNTPLNELKEYARNKGGKCLSNEYFGVNIKLKWKCQRGHVWESVPQHIKNGHWCPQCFEEKRKIKIEDIEKLESERKGKCLSKKINYNEKLQWKCNEGHMFESYLYSVKQGSWCPVCRDNKKEKKRIEKMIELAQCKNGKFLSIKYKSINEKGIWQCELGHVWETTGINVLYKNSWCPICNKNKKKGDKK